ncbi:TMEM56 [Branchiostoma lanceolatum]|uniref:TMEM56 protein n=1 Tax=Branchiostoma lanceolatum TaxID=7740 RepID=A0A8J9Z5A9_BRALA|nr:TMEM56 [Branchiostoma lanceolatum]
MCCSTMAVELFHWLIVAGAFAVSFPIFTIITPAIFRRLVPGFDELTARKDFLIKDAALSICHVFVMATLAWYACLFTDQVPHDVIWHESSLVKVMNSLMVGYCAAACLLMIWYRVVDQASFLHHLVSTYTAYISLTYPCLHYYANICYMMEISGPFVNTRMILKQLGDQSSPLFIGNGLAMVLTFFFGRVLSTIVATYNLIRLMVMDSQQFFQLPVPVLLCYVGGCALFNTLNYYWFFKILRGFVSFFQKRQ